MVQNFCVSNLHKIIRCTAADSCEQVTLHIENKRICLQMLFESSIVQPKYVQLSII